MFDFSGKKVVVTGASSGIGRATALAFVDAGAEVVVQYCHAKDAANALLDEIRAQGGKATALQLDLSDTAAIAEFVDLAHTTLGRLDVWVNNAGADILTGIGTKASVEEKLQQLIQVDLLGTIQTCWAILPIMEKQNSGAIVNMSWDLAIHGFAGINPQLFAATKAGVLGFSRALAKSVSADIRINTVAPGWVHTKFAEEVMEDTYYQERVGQIPLARFATPDDIANTILFLASEQASYIQGEMIKVNGGLI